MADIQVKTNSTKEGWNFDVKVVEGKSQTSHLVSLSKEDLKALDLPEDVSLDQLLRSSFEFLLERESKESILSSFELPLIARYFPEYPTEIQKRVKKS